MRCTNCGWDNADSNSKCEKCGYPLRNGGSENSEKSTIRETLRGTIPESIIEEPAPKKTVPETPVEPKKNNNPAQPHNGTINPWMMPQGGFPSVNYCKLSPVPNVPNEKHMPNDLELKGEKITLNRGNLDPDNMTISQNSQASLTCKNGKWYIKDESLYKTTYVYAAKETPLQNGDIIMMGNRRFVFTED